MDAFSLDLLRDIASGISFAVGSVFLLIGAFGLVRLPDVWSRLHAAGVVDTVGAELILLGMIIQAGFTQATLKLALIGLFLFVTSPTATHAVANASFIAGIRPMRLRRNETADVVGKKVKTETGS
ncbi:monovalent cation/proton antiporter, MnhG/PhaG subunit [Parvibaculum lavamentivorans DS-1]|uniref:Monovalent cation/proton antiporter, MnhG/PhaG subunit n=1 Tax=Parvibaculum lavamentivorans (strain DS-1 / DSM 13023 / NCIMB 13966) TaxID=402881 RepID=A7HXE5_PARL1|nr:monovalent cation/H(+) antiporter subunit G [Parvibaculum lavamentivorans]ABS64578.1 monovalent cation/proton antiporter, MnhG/PhaG subunit [Parvibaculum lavamentivorans DS-1]